MVLPTPYTSYNYKVRVSTIKSVMRPASACSPKFLIVGKERPEYNTPSPTDAGSGEDNLYPRETGTGLL